MRGHLVFAIVLLAAKVNGVALHEHNPLDFYLLRNKSMSVKVELFGKSLRQGAIPLHHELADRDYPVR